MNLAGAYRSIAAGDLVLFSALAVPGLGGWILEWIVQINSALGLAGELHLTAALLLLLHLVGLMGSGLACLRLRSEASAYAIWVTVGVKLGAALLFALFVWRGAPATTGGSGRASPPSPRWSTRVHASS